MGLLNVLKPGQGITPKPAPSFGQQLANGLSNPMFTNGVHMMATGEPPQMGMGPVTNNEFLNAFSGSPQFQQQLQAIRNGQGPGSQAPQFTPPPVMMNTAVPTGASGPVGMNSYRGMRGQLGAGFGLGNIGEADPMAMQALGMFGPLVR